MGESFDKNYLPTLGCDFSSKTFRFNDNRLNISIWDLAGQPRLESIHPFYFQNSSAAIIVYDVTDHSSFQTVEKWLTKFLELSGYSNPIVFFVGNKIDLEKEIQVTTDDHNKVIQQLKDKYYTKTSVMMDFRTSAKDGINIMNLFETMAKQVYKHILGLQRLKFKHTSIEKAVPGIYHSVFHELIGPIVIASVPMDLEVTYDASLGENIVRLFSSLDFEKVTKDKIQVGKIAWTYPEGMAIYNAFVLPDPDARGGYQLHSVIIVFATEIIHLSIQREEQIWGHLHGTANSIQKTFARTNLPMNKMLPEEVPNHLKLEFVSLLEKLRSEIYHLLME